MDRIPSYTDLERMNDAEWRQFIAIVSMAQKARASKKMNQFDYGDRVTFVARGIRYTGTVQKFNRKTVAVRTTSGTIWRVSPNLLSPVAATEKAPA